VWCRAVRAGGGEDAGGCSGTGGKAVTLQERRLLNCLLHDDYDPAVRPATLPSAPVHVIVDSIVATVIDLVRRSPNRRVSSSLHFAPVALPHWGRGGAQLPHPKS